MLCFIIFFSLDEAYSIANNKLILSIFQMFLTRSEYDRGVNTFSPEGRLFQVGLEVG